MQGISRDIVWRNMEEELQGLCLKAGGITQERTSGVIGYSLLDLSRGKRIGFQDDLLFPTASTIKIAVLLALATRVRQGELSWEQRLTVGTEGKAGGSGILTVMKHEVELSLWDLATLMIALSDNHATNTCIDFTGFDFVNNLLSNLGLTRTRLRRKMMDAEAVARGEENVATPRELVNLLLRIYRSDGVPAEVSKDVLTLLELPKSGPFALALPDSVRRANKPGSLSRVRVDAGIVYLPGLDFCIAVMGSYLSKDEQHAEMAVADVIAAAYRYMALLGDCNDLGRPQAF